MRGRLILLTFLLLTGVALTGCGKRVGPLPPAITENITLFYGDEGNEKMVTEQRQISFNPEDDKYKLALIELIKGPNNQNYMANIDPKTIVYGTIRQDTSLIVDFSEEFNRFNGTMAEIIGIGSVVNTLTTFEEIKKVKILVEGEDLIAPSGSPRGFMGPFSTKP